MEIRLEPNKRLGYGLQIRLISGPYCEVYDDEPLTPLEAIGTMQEALERMSQETGIGYRLSLTGGIAKYESYRD